MTKLWDKIYVHPLTYVIILISLLSGLFKYTIIISIIIIIHELGHIFAIFAFKRSISKIIIYPFGGLIKMSSPISSDIREDLFIAISGISIQLLLGLLLYLLYQNKVIDYSIYSNMYFYNNIIISFNLLPLCPLDGAKIIKLISEILLPYKTTFAISFITSIITIFGIMIFNSRLIYNNVLVFLFILISTFFEFKNKDFYVIRFYIERLNQKFKFTKYSYITRIDDMYKNRYHNINGLDENEYLKKYFQK